MAGRNSERQIVYAEEVYELLNDYKNTMNAYSIKVIEMLDDIQRRIRYKIFSISEEAWLKLELTKMSGEIENLLKNFNIEYNATLLNSLRDSAKSGINIVIEPMKNNLDVSLMFTEPSFFTPVFMDEAIRATWNIASTNIVGVTEQVARNIISEIMQGITIGDTRSSIVDKIAGQLGGEKLGFSTLNERAWTIFRTETSKMQSFATELQMRGVMEIIPEAEKVWHHGVWGIGQRPRPGHVALDGVSVPMIEPFYNGNTGQSLMFPHDPNAPASEVCNCGCAHSAKMPDESYLRSKTMVNV